MNIQILKINFKNRKKQERKKNENLNIEIQKIF